jgi:beta-lactam-binding protein with PASTA domain
MNMKWLKFKSWKDVLIHTIVITILGSSAISFFFYVYLPMITNHGETITVPDVVGMNYEQLDEFLTSRNLRYEITPDSGYSSDLERLAVLKQFPQPLSKVKENRKIYLTLNADSPPLVRMPDLVEGSLKNAQMVLKSYDLKLGKTQYVPDLFFNTILEQKINGNRVTAGDMVPKGSIVDVVVGDGMGRQELESPNVIGLDEESAQIAIIGSGLQVGEKVYQKDNNAVITSVDNNGETTRARIRVSPGSIVRQSPEPGVNMRLKGVVSIWIYQPDSVDLRPSILDNQ